MFYFSHYVSFDFTIWISYWSSCTRLTKGIIWITASFGTEVAWQIICGETLFLVVKLQLLNVLALMVNIPRLHIDVLFLWRSSSSRAQLD
jgi:hypothetical protein